MTDTGKRVLEEATATADEFAKDLLHADDLKRMRAVLPSLRLRNTRLAWKKL
jgi:hypothetical protein